MPYIIGKRNIIESLKSGNRIEKILVRFGTKVSNYPDLNRLASELRIKIHEIDKRKFDSQFSDQNTQGIVAYANPKAFIDLDDLIDKALKKNKYPFLLILENIQDTNNIGAILRSAECFNADGIIITKDNTAPIDESAGKASAGAIEYLDICRITNLSQTIDTLKQKGFWIYGTTDHGTKTVKDIQFDSPIAVIMGNESKGLRKLTMDKCDFTIKIPLYGQISSLNVSVAAGIFMYELNQKRMS